MAVAERQRLVRRIGGPSQRVGETGEPIDCAQRRPRLVQQPRSRGREVHLPGRPLEQLHAQLGLELAYSLRERGSGHVQPSRGATEMLLFGDGHEVGQPPKIHRRDRSTARTRS